MAFTELRVSFQRVIANAAFLTFALASVEDLRAICAASILFCCLSSQDAVTDDLAYTNRSSAIKLAEYYPSTHCSPSVNLLYSCNHFNALIVNDRRDWR